ncbi:MAG TPA: Ldh family oxidoreductase [Lichenihabitans sp.]|jgi:LDH2 family malate/lactate/ureidoglycolate dehydrogenase|nr:Ldh family oxidoreductase [Lichenihabitans sp.]
MPDPTRIDAPALAARLSQRLTEAGAAVPSAEAATQAMMHASRLGVDSHGARLAEFYCTMLRDGRVNPRPSVTVRRTALAAAIVDGDDGLGHLTAYRAMAEAIGMARETGIAAAGALRSSHFGAAGAYALHAAEAGLVGISTTNADSLVTLFGGSRPFHGTNPIAVAAPVAGAKPWLLDMATSAIPFNRVLLYRSLGVTLPPGTAADAEGSETRRAEDATMLMPLGGTDFGFKGAALAGVATLLSAVLLGMALDHDLDFEAAGPGSGKPPNLGHFFIAIDPKRFAGEAAFARGMRRYLDALRAVAPRMADEGAGVMAPGDREWRVEAERMSAGIPIDPDTARFLGFSE